MDYYMEQRWIAKDTFCRSYRKSLSKRSMTLSKKVQSVEVTKDYFNLFWIPDTFVTNSKSSFMQSQVLSTQSLEISIVDTKSDPTKTNCVMKYLVRLVFLCLFSSCLSCMHTFLLFSRHHLLFPQHLSNSSRTLFLPEKETPSDADACRKEWLRCSLCHLSFMLFWRGSFILLFSLFISPPSSLPLFVTSFLPAALFRYKRRGGGGISGGSKWSLKWTLLGIDCFFKNSFPSTRVPLDSHFSHLKSGKMKKMSTSPSFHVSFATLSFIPDPDIQSIWFSTSNLILLLRENKRLLPVFWTEKILKTTQDQMRCEEEGILLSLISRKENTRNSLRNGTETGG